MPVPIISMITPQNIARHELTGLEVTIAASTDPGAKGVSGVVSGETRNMISIKSSGKVKRFQKEGSVFSFRLPGGERVKVDGKILVARPEDRIKKKLKAW